MRIGPYIFNNKAMILAPMAGITDRPFRQLCKDLGTDLAVSEMVASDPRLWNSRKTRRRIDHDGESGPRSVQIVGFDPAMLVAAARFNVAHGAQIIDINMGCPAKKVCNILAGSALLRDEPLVGRILEAVVKAVSVPVTLKIRTGWDPAHRNGVQIARIAEQSGVQAVAVHGRTRACGYRGEAEYDTVRAIKQTVAIPVIVNGDITSPEKAKSVLDATGADAVMIGRAAQGRPWIFREIAHYLATGERLPTPTVMAIGAIVRCHLEALYAFYGDYPGVWIARKHLTWYSRHHPRGTEFRARVNRVETVSEQLAVCRAFFNPTTNNRRLAA
ncbi:MAG: tRNA dihydrouridine synthase DusB [Candidatus Competibacteraceae bacterium]